jgi:hypothetical protein
MARILFTFLFINVLTCVPTEQENNSNKIATSKPVATLLASPPPLAPIAFEDGKHCATVEYHNPKTGNTSSYKLSVEILQNELTKLYWPNGGWLDQNHFCCATLDHRGHTSFTSDKGQEYQVTLTTYEECND